jgi:tetratricopeptide (TPR) repeat protein
VAVQANYNLGLASRQQGRLQQARTYLRRALAADPSFGNAIIEIATVYAEAIRDCGGSEMAREDRAVYWLVADYLERARSVDSSLAGTVSRTIQQYKPFFPSAEDLFFKGWTAGDDYPVNYGCYSWMNETTKVRNP